MPPTSLRFVVTRILVAVVLTHIAHASDVAGSLSGLQLRCCVIHEPPIAFIDHKTYLNVSLSRLSVPFLVYQLAVVC